MTYRKSFDVYDFYDRAKTGEKITQDDWDLMVLPSKTMELKQKYGLDFKGEFVPTDKDMMEKLFKAGFELLLECGIFCTDTHRVVKYTETRSGMLLKMQARNSLWELAGTLCASAREM
jgi:methylamine--corrinoid protein Co-methyltransferase